MKGPQGSQKTYGVSEITLLIKRTLESDFSRVSIEGEVTNLREAGSGHLYFSLSDKESIIQAVMFRSRASRLTFRPIDGQNVVVRGFLTVYAKRGVYQIVCDSVKKAGEGELLALIEERKQRLAAEGLFDEGRKQPLPLFPAKVAVVTSSSGAAIRDILQVIQRRSSGIDLVILPAAVQGAGAAEAIARQIRTASLHKLGEVLIVGRGGGSIEDLLPFSQEVVVRAVAESAIPVISAVGHEVDLSLSDLAADLRAPTPSAAAELVSAQRDSLLDRVRRVELSMSNAVGARVSQARLAVDRFQPERLERSFRILIQPLLLRLDDAKELLLRGVAERAEALRHRVELAVQRLESISPRRILDKGYALVVDGSGSLVEDSQSLSVGGEVGVTLARGGFDARVEEIRPE